MSRVRSIGSIRSELVTEKRDVVQLIQKLLYRKSQVEVGTAGEAMVIKEINP